MNRLLVLVMLCACGKGGGVNAAIAKAKPAMAAMRPKLAAAKAELDKHPDASTYPACAPGQKYTYTPYNPGHDIDLIDYPALTGPVAMTGALRTVVGYSTLVAALSLTEEKGSDHEFGPDAVAMLGAAPTVKTIVVVKERTASTETSVSVDAFVMTLEPPKVTCVIAGISGSGGSTTEGGERYVQRSWDHDSQGNIKNEKSTEFTVGAKTTTSYADNTANGILLQRLYNELRFAPYTCSEDDLAKEKNPLLAKDDFCRQLFKFSRCTPTRTCVYDPELEHPSEATVTKERAAAFQMFDATHAKDEECFKMGHQDPKWLDCTMAARDLRIKEEIKAGISQETAGNYYKEWTAAREPAAAPKVAGPTASADAGSGFPTIANLQPRLARDGIKLKYPIDMPTVWPLQIHATIVVGAAGYGANLELADFSGAEKRELPTAINVDAERAFYLEGNAASDAATVKSLEARLASFHGSTAEQLEAWAHTVGFSGKDDNKLTAGENSIFGLSTFSIVLYRGKLLASMSVVSWAPLLKNKDWVVRREGNRVLATDISMADDKAAQVAAIDKLIK